MLVNETLRNAEADFLVKESKGFNYFIGILLLIIFVVAIALGDYGWSNYLSAMALFLIPAAFFIAKARGNAVRIKINKSGFYYNGALITSWDRFIDARLTQDLVPGSIKDNFIILIRYYGHDPAEAYWSKIPLSNTQDKADEEIIAAIDFYYKASRENTWENTSPIEKEHQQ